jgi:hypothetical protein
MPRKGNEIAVRISFSILCFKLIPLETYRYYSLLYIGPFFAVQRPVSLAIFFLTDLDFPRVPGLDSYMLSGIGSPGCSFRHYFVNYSLVDQSNPPSLAVPLELSDKYVQLIAKLFFSVRFFLIQSSCAWFLHATDGTIINFRKLGAFMQDLQSSCNPYRDVRILGDCIQVRENAYLQGGSGSLNDSG